MSILFDISVNIFTVFTLFFWSPRIIWGYRAYKTALLVGSITPEGEKERRPVSVGFFKYFFIALYSLNEHVFFGGNVPVPDVDLDDDELWGYVYHSIMITDVQNNGSSL